MFYPARSGIFSIEVDVVMINESITRIDSVHEPVTHCFLETSSEESFDELFKTLSPQLVAFFRARGCEGVAEDLAQEVMFTVYRKAGQVRDKSLFRAWIFTIARNALYRHWDRRSREVSTVDLAEVPERFVAANKQTAGPPAFEFNNWMELLDSQEREALALRFVEDWEYHEIAAAKTIPIGTVQWRVFNAKKKLAPHLRKIESLPTRMAA